MKLYNKLIRDRIIELIEKDEVRYSSRVLNVEEFKRELLKKIVEEANEVLETNGDSEELIKEIADVLEVLDSIIETFELDRDRIQSVKAERRSNRGGFAKRIFLEAMDDKKME